MFGAPAAAAPATSLFGQPAAASTGFSFGQQAAAPAAAGGLFGKPAVSTGLFGQPAATAAPAPSMFGAPAAAKPGFSFGAPAAAAPQASLFGQPQASTSLFGQPAAQPSLFGQPQQAQQPTLQASLDKNPYGINPLLQRSTNGAPAKPLPQVSTPVAQEKKKTTTPSFKVPPRSISKIKLRGTAPAHAGPSLESPVNHMHIRDGSPKDTAQLGLDSRFTPRRSVKRVVINQQTPDVSSAKKDRNVVFDSSLHEMAVNKMTPAKPVVMQPLVSKSTVHMLTKSSPAPRNGSPLQETILAAEVEFTEKKVGYTMSPPLEELLLLSDAELRNVENFHVSLEGFGSVRFLKPVDLLHDFKTRSKLSKIPGHIVLIESKVLTVYPDEEMKPPVGLGLNVEAVIELYSCWPIDKSTREYIINEGDARVERHIAKLQRMPDTHFLGFCIADGCWKFKVDHFR
jgi:nuclear pore complex protein Nup98-Nup96